MSTTFSRSHIDRLHAELSEYSEDSRRRFPSFSNLQSAGIVEIEEEFAVARMLWKHAWARMAVKKLRQGGHSDILDLLPKTRQELSQMQFPDRLSSANIRLMALNEFLDFHGVEVIHRTRKEHCNGEWVEVTVGSEISAMYLNAGDPYVATLVYRPRAPNNLTVRCWGDLPEVNK